jgi:hypothetical protein
MSFDATELRAFDAILSAHRTKPRAKKMRGLGVGIEAE